MPLIAKATLLSIAAFAACGCTVMNGDALEGALDRSIVTGSIAPPPPREDVSDSRTVRNAVSSADIASLRTAPLAWSNSDTGTSGAITSITEAREGNVVCRTFTTSRQRFDGVALYAGEACTRGEGEWVLTRFSESG